MRDQFAARIHRDGIAIENQLIVSADDVAITDRAPIGARERGDHLVPNRGFAQVKGRGAEIHNQFRALIDQAAHRLDVVERPRQIMFRPDVFADRDADLPPAKINGVTCARRLEVTVFIEHIVGRQKRFVRFRIG